MSFEVYVWHVPIFSTIKLLSATRIVNTPSSFLDMIIITMVVVAVAVIMYYAVEKKITEKLRVIVHPIG